MEMEDGIWGERSDFIDIGVVYNEVEFEIMGIDRIIGRENEERKGKRLEKFWWIIIIRR